MRCCCSAVLLLCIVLGARAQMDMAGMDMTTMDSPPMDMPAMTMPSAMAPSPMAVMEEMMQMTDANMMAVPACSSVDITFARMMIAHHQGAISMAQWYLQHGSNPELTQISNSIVSSQMMEISQMQAILATLPMPADCMSMAPGMAPAMSMGGMSTMNSSSEEGAMGDMAGMAGMDMGDTSTTAMAASPGIAALEGSMSSMTMGMAPAPGQLSMSADEAFTTEMRMHHQAAVAMAQAEVQYGAKAQLIDIAKQIISEQTAQITQFDEIMATMASTA